MIHDRRIRYSVSYLPLGVVIPLNLIHIPCWYMSSQLPHAQCKDSLLNDYPVSCPPYIPKSVSAASMSSIPVVLPKLTAHLILLHSASITHMHLTPEKD